MNVTKKYLELVFSSWHGLSVTFFLAQIDQELF